MATASTSGLNSARNKLDGLLKELIDKTDESAEGNLLHGLDSLAASMPPPSTPTKRSATAKGPRKRRKKDISFDGASYIMKLFDRSVDFAPFNEDTPLYTLAKEWMENKPYRQRWNSEKEDITEIDPLSSSQGSSTSSTSETAANEANLVYSLPAPSHVKYEKELSCIPDPIPQTGPPLNTIGKEPVSSPSELKRNHLQRWKKIKKSWRESSVNNQARYYQSIKKIRELYQN